MIQRRQDNNQRFDGCLDGSQGVCQDDATDFSAVAANDMLALSEIAAVLNQSVVASRWERRAAAMIGAIDALLWNESAGIYLERHQNGTHNPAVTPAGLMPLLFADRLPPRRVARLVANIVDPKVFGTPAGLPTVSASDPTFSNNMWRGGMWPNVNYLVIKGLVAANRTEQARALAAQTVATAARWYGDTGCLFEYYDATGAVAPCRVDRKSCLGCGSTREYHWTAGSLFAMIDEFDLHAGKQSLLA